MPPAFYVVLSQIADGQLGLFTETFITITKLVFPAMVS